MRREVLTNHHRLSLRFGLLVLDGNSIEQALGTKVPGAADGRIPAVWPLAEMPAIS